MYRILQVDKYRWEIYYPNSHKPFASYAALVECLDVLLITSDCNKISITLKK